MNNFRFVDLFCGGGGSITGAIDALNTAGVRYEGRGFNHWNLAIQTIQLNHPEIIPDFNRAIPVNDIRKQCDSKEIRFAIVAQYLLIPALRDDIP